MIDIPLNDIIAKIKEQKNLSDAEVRAKIKEKLAQLSGLISEQGAAHIVANELGIDLVKHGAEAKIRDLYPGMRAVTVSGRVTRKFPARAFEKNGRVGKVASFFIGDETGQIKVTLWNDQAKEYDALAENDIVRVKNGYVKEGNAYQGRQAYPELHLNNDSKLEIRPAGVTVSAYVPKPPSPAWERKTIKELSGDEENVELLCTVVQVYDPRYFDVCPHCNKRVTVGSQNATPSALNAASCAEHGVVAPQTNYVVSAFLDDGTGNIRATFWKQQAQRLTGKSDEELLQYQQNPAAFEVVKQDLLGEIIKIVGKCKKNETFDRIEITANLVFKDVDPSEELARMADESKASVEKLDASVDVKEAMKKVLDPPKKPAKVEVETETLKDEVDEDDDFMSDHVDEEAISLDDLEDLDEKI